MPSPAAQEARQRLSELERERERAPPSATATPVEQQQQQQQRAGVRAGGQVGREGVREVGRGTLGGAGGGTKKLQDQVLMPACVGARLSVVASCIGVRVSRIVGTISCATQAILAPLHTKLHTYTFR